jgi:hypothetical protein
MFDYLDIIIVANTIIEIAISFSKDSIIIVVVNINQNYYLIYPRDIIKTLLLK